MSRKADRKEAFDYLVGLLEKIKNLRKYDYEEEVIRNQIFYDLSEHPTGLPGDDLKEIVNKALEITKGIKKFRIVDGPRRTTEACPHCGKSFLEYIKWEDGYEVYYCRNPECGHGKRGIEAEKLKEIKEVGVEEVPPWAREGFGKFPPMVRERLKRNWYKSKRKKAKKEGRYKPGKMFATYVKSPWKWFRKKGREEKKEEIEDIRTEMGLYGGEGEIKEEDERYEEAKKKFEAWAEARGLDKDSDEYKERLKKLEDGYKKRRELAKKRIKEKGYEFPRGWPGGPFARGLTAMDEFFGKHSEHVSGVMPFIIVLGLGAVASVILGSLMFFFAFFSLAFYFIFPPAKEKKDREGRGTGEWEHLGSAYIKSVLKCTSIVLFAWATGATNLPFANIFLMLIALGGYAAMKVTYHDKRPDELVESFIRFGFLGVFVIPFTIFSQIFGSMTLGLMALMFFAVPPIKVGSKTEEIERTFAYQIWKPIFLIGMLIVLVSSGALGSILPGLSIGWELTGSLSYIFIYVWFVSFMAGIFTSPESLPSIGMIVLIVTTIIFGLGPGSQNIGIALFGQWWPTIHNTVGEFTKPLGDLFYQLSQTFGQTLFMLTNPMGFAQQITEGTYVENPTGPTGAYGLEIDNLQVDSIYVGEPFSVRFELSNKGSFDAKNAHVEIWSNVNQFNISDHTDSGKTPIKLRVSEKSERITGYIDWFKYKYPQSYEIPPKPTFAEPVIKQDIKPLFYLGNMTCEGQTYVKKKWGITTAAGATLREKYISFLARINYTYEVYSNLQIEIISMQEWDSRVRSGLLLRGQKLSRISTAPAKLSLGAMDQPIREDLPMFIGFNLSSAEGPRSKIGASIIILELPKEFKEKNPQMRCTDKKNRWEESQVGDKWIIKWKIEKDESKSVFCFMRAPDIGDVPSRTFTISASANYTFHRWERKDSLINFRDACERGDTTPVGGNGGTSSAGTRGDPFTNDNLMVGGKKWNDLTEGERQDWADGSGKNLYAFFKGVVTDYQILKDIYLYDPENKTKLVYQESTDYLNYAKNSKGEAICINGMISTDREKPISLVTSYKYDCPS